MYTYSRNYILKYCIDFAPHYQFTNTKELINTKTGRKIRKVLCGRSVGYCINGNFKSLNTLRKHLVKVEAIDCPF